MSEWSEDLKNMDREKRGYLRGVFDSVFKGQKFTHRQRDERVTPAMQSIMKAIKLIGRPATQKSILDVIKNAPIHTTPLPNPAGQQAAHPTAARAQS